MITIRLTEQQVGNLQMLLQRVTLQVPEIPAFNDLLQALNKQEIDSDDLKADEEEVGEKKEA